MIVLFEVDVDGKLSGVRLPIHCSKSDTLQTALSLFRHRLQLPAQLNINLRSSQGAPIELKQSVGSLVSTLVRGDIRGAVSAHEFVVVHALLDGSEEDIEDTVSSVEEYVSRTTTTKSDLEEDCTDTWKPVGDAQVKVLTSTGSLENLTSQLVESIRKEKEKERQQKSEEELLDGSHAQNGTGDVPEDDSDFPGLQTIRDNLPDEKFSLFKSYARCDVAFGDVVLQEAPLLSVCYPMQLAELVRSNAKLRVMSFDPKRPSLPSSISGVSDDEFSRHVSTALTYGLSTSTADQFEKQLAFYPDTLCSIRHSCSPNCYFVRRELMAPFRGVLICCSSPDGVRAGAEWTVLYPNVSSRAFLLLPYQRRQAILRKFYHQRCACSRCWKADRNKCALESSLVGAFTASDLLQPSQSVVKSTTTSNADEDEMRKDFLELGLLEDEEGEGPSSSEPHKKTPLSFSSIEKRPREFSLTKTQDIRHLIQKLQAFEHFLRKYSVRSSLCRFFPDAAGKGNIDAMLPPSKLQLHENHWRLSLVRIAYLSACEAKCHIDRIASQQQERKGQQQTSSHVLQRFTFDVALTQLAVESRFIPCGHPLSLPSYKVFQSLVAALPDKLCKSVQKVSRTVPEINWTALQSVSSTYSRKVGTRVSVNSHAKK